MGACQAHAPNSDSTQGSPRIFETFRQVWLDSSLKKYEITDPPSEEHPPGCAHARDRLPGRIVRQSWFGDSVLLGGCYLICCVVVTVYANKDYACDRCEQGFRSLHLKVSLIDHPTKVLDTQDVGNYRG